MRPAGLETVLEDPAREGVEHLLQPILHVDGVGGRALVGTHLAVRQVDEGGDELDARVRALQAGWEATREMIRPGVSYQQLTQTAHAAVKAAGFNGDFRMPVPHCLGLEHTDDPRSVLLPVGSKPDRVLEENMVLNVDMPHTEIGWGSIHLEDTVRVTADGCEPLTAYPTRLRTIPAH